MKITLRRNKLLCSFHSPYFSWIGRQLCLVKCFLISYQRLASVSYLGRSGAVCRVATKKSTHTWKLISIARYLGTRITAGQLNHGHVQVLCYSTFSLFKLATFNGLTGLWWRCNHRHVDCGVIFSSTQTHSIDSNRSNMWFTLQQVPIESTPGIEHRHRHQSPLKIPRAYRYSRLHNSILYSGDIFPRCPIPRSQIHTPTHVKLSKSFVLSKYTYVSIYSLSSSVGGAQIWSVDKV